MGIYYSKYISPVGMLTVTVGNGLLTGIWFNKKPVTKDRMEQNVCDPVIHETERWLDSYFAGEKPDPQMIPITFYGSEFQVRVWKLLLEIPYGKTVTYGALAHRVAKDMRKEKMSAQAVGGAVGKNPISVLVPCHRVIGINGNLTGYGGGIDNKIWLLKHEGIKTDIRRRP